MYVSPSEGMIWLCFAEPTRCVYPARTSKWGSACRVSPESFPAGTVTAPAAGSMALRAPVFPQISPEESPGAERLTKWADPLGGRATIVAANAIAAHDAITNRRVRTTRPPADWV